MQKVKYKGSYIYIDNTPVEDGETGIIIKDDALEETEVYKPIDKRVFLEDTNINIFGDEEVE